MPKCWYQLYVLVVSLIATSLTLYTPITPIFVPLMLGTFLAFFLSEQWPFFWVFPLVIFIPLLEPQYRWDEINLLLEVAIPVLALMIIMVTYRWLSSRVIPASFLNSIIILAVGLWIYYEGVYWIMSGTQNDILFFYSNQIPRMFRIVAYNITYVMVLAAPVTWLQTTLGE